MLDVRDDSGVAASHDDEDDDNNANGNGENGGDGDVHDDTGHDNGDGDDDDDDDAGHGAGDGAGDKKSGAKLLSDTPSSRKRKVDANVDVSSASVGATSDIALYELSDTGGASAGADSARRRDALGGSGTVSTQARGDDGDADNNDGDRDEFGDKDEKGEKTAAPNKRKTKAGSKKRKTVKLRLTHEQYREVTLAVLSHLRRNAQVENDGESVGDLIEWRLTAMRDDLTSKQEVRAQRAQFRAILQNMIERDHSLLVLSAHPTDDLQTLVTAHPNFVAE